MRRLVLYTIAAAMIVAVAYLRRVAGPGADGTAFLLPCLAVVSVVSWLGGVRVGLFGTVLASALTLPYPFVWEPADLVRGLGALAVGVLVSVTVGVPYRPWSRADALAAQAQFWRELMTKPGTAVALRTTERYFHRLAAAMPQILWAALPSGRLDYYNRRVYEPFGLSESTASSPDALMEAIHPDDRGRYRECWTAAVRSGEPAQVEYRSRAVPGGEYRWHLGRFLPVRDDAGQVERWFCTGSDIDDQKRAEEQVRAGERHLASILAAIPDPFFKLDREWRFLHTNARWSAHFGVPWAEVAGRPFWDVFPELVGTPAEEEYRRVMRDATPATFEWRAASAGRWYEVHAFPVPEGVAAYLNDVTDRREAEAALRAARDELETRVRERTAELTAANAALTAEVRERARTEAARQELLARLTTAQEEERSRIARELHDQMGQHLTALSIGLRVVRGAVPDPSPALDRLLQLQRLTEQLGREAHRLAVELRPSALDDIGLRAAVQNYVDEWAGRSGVEVDYHASGLDGGRLPRPVETAVYRVVQEALTNVAKHAGASRVSVVIRRAPGQLSVVVEDNGHGFDAERVMAPGGSGGRLGLLGMSERAAQVGGVLVVESGPGRGTTLIIRVPLPPDAGRNGDVEGARLPGG